MLKVPLLLLFFSDLMYTIISSSEVKSNLNYCSIGFVKKSSRLLCRYNTFFNLFWDIAEKAVKCICYLFFFHYHLSIIVYVPNLLGVFFVDVDNLFDTCPNLIQFILIFFRKGFIVIYFTQSSYFIKKIPIGLKKVVQFLFFVAFFVLIHFL